MGEMKLISALHIFMGFAQFYPENNDGIFGIINLCAQMENAIRERINNM